jgi:hypothetical protein
VENENNNQFPEQEVYNTGLQEGIELGIQAGREITAREVFEELDNLFNVYDLWELTEDYEKIKSRYGVTE